MQSINIKLPMAPRSISRFWDCVGKEASAVGEAEAAAASGGCGETGDLQPLEQGELSLSL